MIRQIRPIRPIRVQIVEAVPMTAQMTPHRTGYILLDASSP